MAFASLFTLLDDIVSVLDDVALMTKMAAKKTAGVVGDDLALNANQVTGVKADRELPIVWAVAKGSLVNKAILVPVAILLSVFIPILIKPLLLLGGAFLCFEGVEKLLHQYLNRETAEEPRHAVGDELTDEKTKVKGAIRTDFILSAEIIIIALGVVENYGVASQAVVLAIIGIAMTVLVYGVVAVIVKTDDFGMWLMKKPSAAVQALGKGMILFMPWFMRALSVIGMLAMFLVGGGIIVHNLDFVHHFLHMLHWDTGIRSHIANLVVGVLSGALVCAVVLPLMKLMGKNAAH
ncbi:DUF808 domain-containing protein [Neisseria zalophi]|uniref:DUF808 domain-containing protein n=1 Tax=Neisseria zalophi TaxID=640030 RepID=A0A5J6Q153_9NEIS|nr:DUF808 domain-containing protein [Neisseria zalophi]QEY26922.1 DUF808 domain-containing protein [Neisseria zalophi]